MSMIAERVFKKIEGKKCSQFRFVEGGTLILYFGAFDNDATDTRLWIDCAWRLRDALRVVTGSMDESELVLQVLQRIRGRDVEDFTVDDETGDFRLTLNPGIIVDTFAHTTIDEIWELRDKTGLRLGIGPQSKPFERYEAPDES